MDHQTELFPQEETTAIYPNRRRDKTRVEHELHLTEKGNETTRFQTPLGTLLAVGYVRIVYGDHGPYIEFRKDQIRAELEPKFKTPLPSHCYYEWLIPTDGSEVKVYDQKKDVKNLKNAPAGGYKGNRTEGYADYKVGMIYISPWETTIAK